MRGWIGVDLDGTLAHHGEWRGHKHIGEPIMPMVERVRSWVREGQEVRIMTARAYAPNQHPEALRELQEVVTTIQDWLETLGLPRLRVTCQKDYAMVALYDDRAIQVRTNTGELVT